MNKTVADNVYSILNHLKTTDGYDFLVAYFKEKQKDIIDELVKSAGVLTHEELLEANARLNIYKDLENFDKLVKEDLL